MNINIKTTAIYFGFAIVRSEVVPPWALHILQYITIYRRSYAAYLMPHIVYRRLSAQSNSAHSFVVVARHRFHILCTSLSRCLLIYANY